MCRTCRTCTSSLRAHGVENTSDRQSIGPEDTGMEEKKTSSQLLGSLYDELSMYEKRKRIRNAYRVFEKLEKKQELDATNIPHYCESRDLKSRPLFQT
ncbi:hypothetical protein NDU88_001778 [Pleurodeles waltl]|uniref:Uncharacterized protein n=1 Tax=Pleurodeles waltl TaxID=8319 RepID=A0AAV7WMT1_PLEWA|nr:hypothetical protein NDU88_001778 [Pleurodeles waltl]